MEQNEIKLLVGKMLADGKELTEIQNALNQEHGINMTFLELRLMAADLENVDWSKFNKKPKETPEQSSEIGSEKTGAQKLDNNIPTPEPEPQSNSIPESPKTGNTVVTLSKIVRPGAVASGTVKFASGATAEWILDQLGRLGLDKANGKPTPEDLQDFQVELQKALSGAA